MANIRVGKASVSDARSVASRLRMADKRECLFALGMDPERVLSMLVSLPGEKIYVLLVDDSPEALFGVSGNSMSDRGIPWFLGTDNLKNVAKYIVKNSEKWIKKFLKLYPVLENHVSADNKVAIAWLKRFGFEVSAPKPYGYRQSMFCKFRRERHV